MQIYKDKKVFYMIVITEWNNAGINNFPYGAEICTTNQTYNGSNFSGRNMYDYYLVLPCFT